MKRKLMLLTVMLALFVCILALSISASTIYKDENGTELLKCEIADGYHIASYEVLNGGFAKADNDGNALTWYLTETKTEDGNVIKTVKAVKTSECFANGNYTNGVEKLKVVSASWDEGTTSIPNFGNWSGEISKEILFVYIPDSVTSLPQRLFQKTPVIACEIKPTSNLQQINLYMLYEAKSIREIYFPASLTTINDGVEIAYNASRLEKVTFHPNCKITELKQGAFKGCASLKTITLPNSITRLESRVFQDCYKLEYINLGANLYTMTRTENNHSLAFCASALKTVVIPKTFKAENMPENLDYCFQPTWGNTSNITFYFTGTLEEFQAIQAKFAKAGNNGEVCGATVENGRLVLVNHCTTFYGGVHDYTANGSYDNACASYCARCGLKEVKENPSHNTSAQITYENGYTQDGLQVNTCTNSGCNHTSESEAAPIVMLLGYSAKINGSDICVGYAINSIAKEAFEAANEGVKISYGVVAYVPTQEVSAYSPLEIKDGAVSAKDAEYTIYADLGSEYAGFEFVLNGFGANYYDLALIMCAYIYDGSALEYACSVNGKVESLSEANTLTFSSIAK